MQAVLVLENGATFVGKHFGAPINTSGEVGKLASAEHNLDAFIKLFTPSSIPNWHGWLSGIADGSILLRTNSRPYIPSYWKLWSSR